jgi:hypothetical protein
MSHLRRFSHAFGICYYKHIAPLGQPYYPPAGATAISPAGATLPYYRPDGATIISPRWGFFLCGKFLLLWVGRWVVAWKNLYANDEKARRASPLRSQNKIVHLHTCNFEVPGLPANSFAPSAKKLCGFCGKKNVLLVCLLSQLFACSEKARRDFPLLLFST